MKFQSSKHLFFKFILLFFPIGGLIYLTIMAIRISSESKWSWISFITIIAFLFASFVLWLMLYAYRNTAYTIHKNQLSYKMGILKGTIPIHKIWFIKASTYPSSGKRPALDWNGLKIVYGADHVLFVSPASQEDFISLLKQKNETIEVVL